MKSGSCHLNSYYYPYLLSLIYRYELLVSSNELRNQHDNRDKPSLKPGIYLLIVNAGFGLVIYWPEPGCYDDNAPPHIKKNMINFHR